MTTESSKFWEWWLERRCVAESTIVVEHGVKLSIPDVVNFGVESVDRRTFDTGLFDAAWLVVRVRKGLKGGFLLGSELVIRDEFVDGGEGVSGIFACQRVEMNHEKIASFEIFRPLSNVYRKEGSPNRDVAQSVSETLQPRGVFWIVVRIGINFTIQIDLASSHVFIPRHLARRARRQPVQPRNSLVVVQAQIPRDRFPEHCDKFCHQSRIHRHCVKQGWSDFDVRQVVGSRLHEALAVSSPLVRIEVHKVLPIQFHAAPRSIPEMSLFREIFSLSLVDTCHVRMTRQPRQVHQRCQRRRTTLLASDDPRQRPAPEFAAHVPLSHNTRTTPRCHNSQHHAPFPDVNGHPHDVKTDAGKLQRDQTLYTIRPVGIIITSVVPLTPYMVSVYIGVTLRCDILNLADSYIQLL